MSSRNSIHDLRGFFCMLGFRGASFWVSLKLTDPTFRTFALRDVLVILDKVNSVRVNCELPSSNLASWAARPRYSKIEWSVPLRSFGYLQYLTCVSQSHYLQYVEGLTHNN